MRKLFILLFLLIPFVSKGQDPEFSQFYVNNMYLNPAMVGGSECPKTTMLFRDQWRAYGGNYSSAFASYEEYSKNLKGGIGIMFINDQSNNGLSYNSIGASYSNQQNITQNFSMRLAFQLNFTQENINTEGLLFSDMIDPTIGFVFTTNESFRDDVVRYFDLSSGFIGYGDNYYFGASVHHINEPNESFLFGRSTLPAKYTLHGGFTVPIREDMYGTISSLSPNVMYRRQGEFQQLNFGLNVKQDKFINYNIWYRGWLGENFRDAIIIGVGLNVNSMRINYSYDITVSELTPSTGGAHEISLRINYPCKIDRRKFKRIPCVEF